MTELVTVDIGGTNARFAIATVADDGSIELGEVITLGTRDYASLRSAWEAFAERIGRPLPPRGGISFAGPVDGEVLKLTNSPWIVRKALIKSRLGLEDYVIVNDFGAVGYAVSRLKPDDMRHICGPDEPLPPEGVISIVGPGTGLGVAQLLRLDNLVHVIETEGGHIEFAPLDPLEDRMLAIIRKKFRRVSVERLVSGPGLGNIHEALAGSRSARSARSRISTYGSSRSRAMTCLPPPRSIASASRWARSRAIWRLPTVRWRP